MPEVVQLNVGGRIFEAYRKTFEASVYLKTMLSCDLVEDSMDADGRVFVDRDPELFQQVLKLLRRYRYRNQPGLSWEEVKDEADFYQVPDLECLAPEKPVTVVVPDEEVSIRRFTFGTLVTKRGDVRVVVSDSDQRRLPSDLADRLYQLAPYRGAPFCINFDALLNAGFELNGAVYDDNGRAKQELTYECRERVVFYAKAAGTELQVAELRDEVVREDLPQWIRITCRSKISE